MSAGKTLNTSNALYGNITRALSGDLDLSKMVALDGGSDTLLQPVHTAHTESTSQTWTAIQGIARDETNWYAIDTAELRKYDLVNNLLITNSLPFAGLPSGLDHCGDGFVDGLYLYVALSNYSAGTSTVKVIAKYLLSTLGLDSYFDLVDQTNLNASGCCLSDDGAEILVTSYFQTTGGDSRNTDIYSIDKFTGAFIGIKTLSEPAVGIQSITYHSVEEKYYLGSYMVSGNVNRIYVYDRNFNYLTNLDPTFSNGEMEGVEYYDGVLYFNEINGSPRLVNTSNVYISSNTTNSEPINAIGNSLITDSNTILIRMTPVRMFNFNAVFDNTSNANHWESWIYSDGRIAFRVNSGSSIITPSGIGQADVEIVIGATWSNASGTVTTKLNTNGIARGAASGGWIAPPVTGLWLAGENASNNQGDNIYRDIIVFDKVLSDAELLDAYNNFDGFYIADGSGVTVTPNTINSVSVSNNPLIAFNSVVNVSPNSINSAYTALNPLVSLSSTINITPNAVDSVSAANNPIIDFSSLLQVTPLSIDSSSITNNPVVSFTSSLVISPSAKGSLSSSLDPLIEFKSVINLTPDSIGSLSTGNNPFITTGAVQAIGNVTSSFAIDAYSVKYKQSTITVNFK